MTIVIRPTSLPKFDLGALNCTANARATLTDEDISRALSRHLSGDWGELDQHDTEANESALKDGGRLVSVYHSAAGVKFYIITEADRSYTTILLPEDY